MLLGLGELRLSKTDDLSADGFELRLRVGERGAAAAFEVFVVFGIGVRDEPRHSLRQLGLQLLADLGHRLADALEQFVERLVVLD